MFCIVVQVKTHADNARLDDVLYWRPSSFHSDSYVECEKELSHLTKAEPSKKFDILFLSNDTFTKK